MCWSSDVHTDTPHHPIEHGGTSNHEHRFRRPEVLDRVGEQRPPIRTVLCWSNERPHDGPPLQNPAEQQRDTDPPDVVRLVDTDLRQVERVGLPNDKKSSCAWRRLGGGLLVELRAEFVRGYRVPASRRPEQHDDDAHQARREPRSRRVAASPRRAGSAAPRCDTRRLPGRTSLRRAEPPSATRSDRCATATTTGSPALGRGTGRTR